MTTTALSTEGPLVLVGAQHGVALIPSVTPLTRLNYFDGKFLRADDLNREQSYLRSLVELSNQAGGAGIVHGFTTTLGGDGLLDLSPGLAVDPLGRALYLPHPARLDVAELVRRSTETASGAGAAPAAMGEGAFSPCETASVPPASVTTTFASDLYLIALAHAEALCGEEDVYGRLCEDACVTSTNRPLRMEGVVVRALPLSLCPPTCSATWLSATHRRSQVASAYFATERELLGKPMSGARLGLDVWCRGAGAQTGTVVPLAVVAMNGGVVEFLDAWSARRERMETPPRQYWAWQLMMRPWSVYMAQILQFQCHLHSVLANPATPPPTGTDPCSEHSAALKQAVALLDEVEKTYRDDRREKETLAERGMERAADRDAERLSSDAERFRPDFLTRISELRTRWSATLNAPDAPAGTRILINGGIVELPPAGYLPVVPGNVDVATQVRRLLGQGVDLRFCAVRPDYVAHALEEAQHLERICLLEGLEDESNRPAVDILVPDGEEIAAPIKTGRYFETTFGVVIPTVSLAAAPTNSTVGDAAGANAAGAPTSGNIAVPIMATRGEQPGIATNASKPTDSRLGPQFRGAGRSDRLPGGGGEFHFAGLMLQTVDQLVGNIENEYTRVDAKSDLGAKRSFSAGGDLDWAIPDLGGMLRRFTTSFGADRKTAHTKESEDRDNVNGMTDEARLSVNRVSQPAATQSINVPSTQSVPALWLVVRSERSPFALEVGESTPISLEAAGGVSVSRILAGARLDLRGDLFCDQSTASANGRRVRGRARGWVSGHARVEGNGQVETPQLPARNIPVVAELELLPSAGGGTLNITVTTHQGFEFTVSTEWRGEPVLATLGVTIDMIDTLRAVLMARAGGDPAKQKVIDDLVRQLEERNPQLRALRIGTGKLRENPAVAEEANSYHAAAIRALRTIELSLDEDGFRASAERGLFPPPKVVEEKQFLPIRDWVLFHRRRTSSCDCCTPKAAPALPARRYQVYEMTLPRAVSPEQIRQFLERGTRIEQLSEVVGVAEFAGGTARLTAATTPAQIVEGWRLANPARAVIYGAIASEGAAINDGEELGEQRVGRVADVVRSVTPTSAAAEFDVLPLVPAGLNAEGLDGVILLVTAEAAVGSQTHRVVFLHEQGTMGDFLGMVQQNAVADGIAKMGRDGGEVNFADGSDEVADDSMDKLVASWKERFDNFQILDAVVLLPGSGGMPFDVADKQGLAIAVALGHRDGTIQQTRSIGEDIFGDFDAITVVEPNNRP